MYFPGVMMWGAITLTIWQLHLHIWLFQNCLPENDAYTYSFSMFVNNNVIQSPRRVGNKIVTAHKLFWGNELGTTATVLAVPQLVNLTVTALGGIRRDFINHRKWWQSQFLIFQRKFLRVKRGCQASQRKGLTSGEVWGTSGEVRGTSGEVWETSGEPLVTVKFHSERTSGEVAEKLPGKFGELPGKSGGFPEARGSLTPSQRLAKFISKFWWNWLTVSVAELGPFRIPTFVAHPLLLFFSPCPWETDFLTSPVLRGAALFDNSAPALRAQDFYAPLALNCPKGQHLCWHWRCIKASLPVRATLRQVSLFPKTPSFGTSEILFS